MADFGLAKVNPDEGLKILLLFLSIEFLREFLYEFLLDVLKVVEIIFEFTLSRDYPLRMFINC